MFTLIVKIADGRRPSQTRKFHVHTHLKNRRRLGCLGSVPSKQKCFRFFGSHRENRRLSGISGTRGGGGGVALPYKPTRDVLFLRVSFFSIISWTEYGNWSETQKRVITIWSRTKGYCFPYYFPIVLWSKIPKQSIKMHFFLNGLWRLLKNGHLPVKLHSSAPPPPGSEMKCSHLL